MASESSDLEVYDEPPILTLREVSLDSVKIEEPRHCTNLSAPGQCTNNSYVSYHDFLLALQGTQNKTQRSKQTDEIHIRILQSFHNNSDRNFEKTLPFFGNTGTLPILGNTKNLPIFGNTPCTAFCPQCQTHVHTVVVFKQNRSFYAQVLKVLGTALGCCNMPHWLRKMRIHTCPFCECVLGNICN